MRFKGSQAFEEFWSFLQDESPRCLGIVVAAYFEEKLRSLLGKKKGDLNDLIDRSAKANIVTPNEYHDLHVIRKLRNNFAHQLRESDFDDTKKKADQPIEDLDMRRERLSAVRRAFPKCQGQASLRRGRTPRKDQEKASNEGW